MGNGNWASTDVRDPSFITVGPNSDVTLNPRCSDLPMTDSGIWNCDLTGEYLGLVQENQDKYMSVCEVLVYSSYNILQYVFSEA